MTGRLQEELEPHGQLVIFYPTFHCELKYIERYWCGYKWYARENCQHTFDGLRATVPAALCSGSSAIIHRHFFHCMRIIEAYVPRNLRSRCIRLTGRLLTSQSGKSCSNMGRGIWGWGRGTALELLAFCKRKEISLYHTRNTITHDHSDFRF